MTRPLARLGIDALEALFETGKQDLPALKQLIGELAYRNVPRATALLDKAQNVFKFVKLHQKEFVSGTSTPSDTRDLAGTQTSIQDRFEFDVPIFASTEWPKRPPRQVPIAGVAPPVRVVMPTLTMPAAVVPRPAPIAMSVEQAYRVLKATLVSSWDDIEVSRRQLVARAQPDRVAKLESAKRKALQDEAREANVAYKVLLQARS